MQIIDASWKVIDSIDSPRIMQKIEQIGRVSYKSEDKITSESADKFIAARLQQGHESIIEHESITVKFICSRKTSHQLVRHRLASYTQESTRYCAYDEEIVFIKSPYKNTNWNTADLYSACKVKFDAELHAEYCYQQLLKNGCKPEEAALVLPHSVKTEIYMTANLREWRHIFRLRCAENADVEIRNLMCGLRDYLRGVLPVIFGDV